MTEKNRREETFGKFTSKKLCVHVGKFPEISMVTIVMELKKVNNIFWFYFVYMLMIQKKKIFLKL